MGQHWLIVPDTCLTRPQRMHDHGIEAGYRRARQRRHAGACAASRRTALGRGMTTPVRSRNVRRICVRGYGRPVGSLLMAWGMRQRTLRTDGRVISLLLQQ